MLRSITNVRVHFRRNYGCYEPLRMLRSLLCKCYVLTLLTYRCYVVLQHISNMLRLYNKCYDRVRQLFRCYEHLRMLRYFSLQLLRYNAPFLQMLRFPWALYRCYVANLPRLCECYVYLPLFTNVTYRTWHFFPVHSTDLMASFGTPPQSPSYSPLPSPSLSRPSSPIITYTSN